MNRLTIIGNLTRDPELRTTQSGKNVCTFTVAVNRRGQYEETDFFRVSVWNQLGELCHKYLTKGREVAVVGSVSVNAYTAKNGENRVSLEVFAQDVEFLSAKNETAEQPASGAKQHVPGGYEEVTDEDLPF